MKKLILATIMITIAAANVATAAPASKSGCEAWQSPYEMLMYREANVDRIFQKADEAIKAEIRSYNTIGSPRPADPVFYKFSLSPTPARFHKDYLLDQAQRLTAQHGSLERSSVGTRLGVVAITKIGWDSFGSTWNSVVSMVNSAPSSDIQRQLLWLVTSPADDRSGYWMLDLLGQNYDHKFGRHDVQQIISYVDFLDQKVRAKVSFSETGRRIADMILSNATSMAQAVVSSEHIYRSKISYQEVAEIEAAESLKARPRHPLYTQFLTGLYSADPYAALEAVKAVAMDPEYLKTKAAVEALCANIR